jgi:hypothetical protein
MDRSFVEAAGYVDRNENMWSEMIRACWHEWVNENKIVTSGKTGEEFSNYCLKQYGIRCWWNDSYRCWDFQILDPVKYTLFQVKYAQ